MLLTRLYGCSMSLKVSNLSKSFLVRGNSLIFGRKTKLSVLKNISFETCKGECIALIGPNGSGKTTLLKIIAGLILPDQGDVLDHKNQPIKHSKITMVNSNDRSFFWRLSVNENLQFFCATPFKESRKQISEALDLLNLSSKGNTMFMKLSYGERKKVAIARALLSNAKILLLDEITNSLDISAKTLLIQTIKSLLVKGNIELIIFATHALDEVLSLSNRFIYIENKNLAKDQSVTGRTLLSDVESLFT